jgi:hypothetical protein
MARMNLAMKVQKRWFFWPAVVVIMLAGKLGLIRPRPSAEYVDGMDPGEVRAARWLTDHAMRIEVCSFDD